MEAVKNQLRSGLTWAPQNNPNWCQKVLEHEDEVVGFKPCIAARRVVQQPLPVPKRDAFRDILEKFQD